MYYQKHTTDDAVTATGDLIAVPAALLDGLLRENATLLGAKTQLQERVQELEAVIPQIRGKLAMLGREHKRTLSERDALNAECEEILASYEREKERFIGEITRLLTAMEKGGQAVQPGARYVPEVIRDQQEIIAQLRAEKERDEWKQAYARLLALVMTAPLTLGHMRALLFRLSLDGVTFGRPVPTGVWWRYVTDAEKKGAGVSINTYDEGLRVAASMGLYAVRRREPADEAGRPYHEDCLEPTKLGEAYATLDAGQRLAEPPRKEVVSARREKRRQADAAQKEQEERSAQRERAEREVLLQKAYLLEQAQDQRDQAVAERDQAVQELAQASACHGCGSRIDPEHWLCDGCRDRESLVPLVPDPDPMDLDRDSGAPRSLEGLKPNIGFKGDVPNKPNIGFNPSTESKEHHTPTIRVAAPRGPASASGPGGFLERAARALEVGQEARCGLG